MVRRSLESDTAAVSPVIGVILMVAITVVLAAVVFVLAADLGGEAQSYPQASFRASRTDGALTVVQVSGGDVGWDEVSVTGCTGIATSGLVTPGDRITGCSGDVKVVYLTQSLLWYHGEFP